jgi:ribonucleotide reductase beta subunit family protein with ferritin-like domain
MLKNKPSATIVREIIVSAVDCEREFVSESLPVDMIGMNSVLMIQYIEFVADRLLVALDQPKFYNSTNPFPWAIMMGMEGKTNFFERKIGDYQKSGVMNSLKQSTDSMKNNDRTFTTTADNW